MNHPKISQECLALPSCKCARWWGNFGVLERVRARREQIKKLTKIARRDFKSACTGETRLSRHLARRADDDEYWRIVNFLTDIWRSLHTLRAIELSPFKRPLRVHYFWICCKRFRKKSVPNKRIHISIFGKIFICQKKHTSLIGLVLIVQATGRAIVRWLWLLHFTSASGLHFTRFSDVWVFDGIEEIFWNSKVLWARTRVVIVRWTTMKITFALLVLIDWLNSCCCWTRIVMLNNFPSF